MGGIGIIGTGISGLQLALYLQHRGVDTTVYSPRSVEEHRTGRLPNCVMRWAPTVDRERELGVYRREGNVVGAVHVRVAAAHPLGFCGHLAGPANTTDFRLYLPDLLEDYQSRGGRLVVGPVGSGDLQALGRRHDLVVVANGRDGFGGLFPRDPARSPHQTPPRHITAGLYHGVAWPDPPGLSSRSSPGWGKSSRSRSTASTDLSVRSLSRVSPAVRWPSWLNSTMTRTLVRSRAPSSTSCRPTPLPWPNASTAPRSA
jgi:hypothetical protein